MRKFAFLPGALMVAAAVLWAGITLRWTVPAAVLGGGGLLALAVGAAANWTGVREWFGDPRGVFALNTLLSTLLLVAALGLVNALAGLRAVTFDWTEAGRHTLAPETVALIDGLGTDVVLKRMGRSRDTASPDLLEAFAARNPRIRLEAVDIDASPAEARRYGVTRAGSVVVEAGRRFRRVDAVTEPALATAVLQVSSAVEPRVCFAAGEGGHRLSDAGPQGLSGLASVLSASNYEPAPISLLAWRGARNLRRPGPCRRPERPPTRRAGPHRPSSRRAAGGSCWLSIRRSTQAWRRFWRGSASRRGRA